MQELFGTKVYKLSLSSGCTCPNRDGTIGTGGCTFCSEGGSGEFAAPFLPVKEQIALAREKVDAKLPPGEKKYLAYFQSFTNTYGLVERLEALYTETIRQPEIVGLSIGTLLGGSVVIETIFRWPGLGKLAMDAITNRDYPVIQGFVLFTSAVYVVINLLIDICYSWIDPRLRAKGGGS